MNLKFQTVGLLGQYANVRLNPEKCPTYYKKDPDEKYPPAKIIINGEGIEYKFWRKSWKILSSIGQGRMSN
jgi:hypothetical protein